MSLKRGFYGCGLLLALLLNNVFSSEFSPPGFRPAPLGVHALVGAKIVIQPGEVLDSGTIVIRDGLIQAVGTNVVVPSDARVWDLKGATVYAGFIEPYLVLSTNSAVSTDDAAAVSQATLASGGLKFYGAPPTKNDAGGPGYILSQRHAGCSRGQKLFSEGQINHGGCAKPVSRPRWSRRAGASSAARARSSRFPAKIRTRRSSNRTFSSISRFRQKAVRTACIRNRSWA